MIKSYQGKKTHKKQKQTPMSRHCQVRSKVLRDVTIKRTISKVNQDPYVCDTLHVTETCEG